MTGPLDGIRVVELAGIGPGPHAAMLLGDWGADVVRVVRRGPDGEPADLAGDTLLRNRTVVGADLKDPDDLAAVRRLVDAADVLIEGFRPGVTERLGLGPEHCLATNPGLVYGRMTGWGQIGPMAAMAGHDLNYLSITGILDTVGTAERPVVPLNLVGDFGGGSTFLVMGILAALLERSRSGRGQVVDAAIVEGVGQMAQMIWSFRGMGMWQEEREANILDGGAPFYGIYACADGGHVAIGAIEQQFYAQAIAGLGLDLATLPDRDDKSQWPALRDALATAFASRTRDEWTKIFDGTDACVTPVLTMTESLEQPHLRERGAFGSIDGVPQPMPAPRFDRSVPPAPTAPGARVATCTDVADRWQDEVR
ncbi:CaiB/BaiF CoA-transferase family protein [soil metagenome]